MEREPDPPPVCVCPPVILAEKRERRTPGKCHGSNAGQVLMHTTKEKVRPVCTSARAWWLQKIGVSWSLGRGEGRKSRQAGSGVG